MKECEEKKETDRPYALTKYGSTKSIW